MILRQSFDGESVLLFLDKTTNEIVEFQNNIGLNLDCDLFDDDNLIFLKEKHIPVIEDSWNETKPFLSENINLLVECDYCGSHYIISKQTRENRISSFKSVLRKTGTHIPRSKNSSYNILYKDNCKKCRKVKFEETKELTGGKYWYENMSEEEKRKFSLKRKNDIRYSRGQKYIANLLNGELNKPIGFYFADIVLDDSVIIEYDGSGHWLSMDYGTLDKESFERKEKKRENYLINKGYKILRVVSKEDYFPENEDILKQILLEKIADLYLDEKDVDVIEFTKKNTSYGKMKHIKNILEEREQS